MPKNKENVMPRITPYGLMELETRIVAFRATLEDGKPVHSRIREDDFAYYDTALAIADMDSSGDGAAYHHAILYDKDAILPFPTVDVYREAGFANTSIGADSFGDGILTGKIRAEFAEPLGKITSEEMFYDLFPAYDEWEDNVRCHSPMLDNWWNYQRQYGSNDWWARRERLKFLWPMMFGSRARTIPRFISHPMDALKDAIDQEPHALVDSYIYNSHVADGMLAYQEFNENKRNGDRQIREVRLGRLLRRLYSSLSDDIIRETVAYSRLDGGCTLKFAETPEEFDEVYGKGPSSCMSKGVDYYDISSSTGLRPNAVLANGDIRLAYLELPNGQIPARTLVVESTKEYVQIYVNDSCLTGAKRILMGLLDVEHYTENGSALLGQKFPMVKGDGGYVCPYIDNNNFSVDEWGNDTFIIRDRGEGEYESDYETGGIRTDCCPRCEERVSYCEHEHHSYDSLVCEACADNGSTIYAHTYRSDCIVLCEEDDVIYCESDDDYYHVDFLDRHSISYCNEVEGYFFQSDMHLVDGVYYHEEECTYLAYRDCHILDRLAILVDGQHYHPDDVEFTDGEPTLINLAAPSEAA